MFEQSSTASQLQKTEGRGAVQGIWSMQSFGNEFSIHWQRAGD